MLERSKSICADGMVPVAEQRRDSPQRVSRSNAVWRLLELLWKAQRTRAERRERFVPYY